MVKKTEFVKKKVNFLRLDQITRDLRNAGLESSKLIFAIDCTESNKWKGKYSYNMQNLHAIGHTLNLYEKVICTIGRTFAPFNNEDLIPCLGFGDTTTKDRRVFHFRHDASPCHGFQEVLGCYRKKVPSLQLSGPTSYAPVIDAAIDIVEKSGRQFHVLVIIADGQVKEGDGKLSKQEEKTINSIVKASSHPLSIVVVGVGDGPWEGMMRFMDKIPARGFNNFKFVNYVVQQHKIIEIKDFARAALMEIPIQYKTANRLGLLGHRNTGRAVDIASHTPLVRSNEGLHDHRVSNLSSQALDVQTQVNANTVNYFYNNSVVNHNVIEHGSVSTGNVCYNIGTGAGGINYGKKSGAINIKHMEGSVSWPEAERGHGS